jgi:type I restriction enzyme S subunit
MPFPQCQLGVQRHIAAVLDTLDEAILKTKATISKIAVVKQGLLHELLTRGIDESGELRPPICNAPHLFKDSPIGQIPESWNCSVVNAEFDVQAGLTLGPHRVPRQSPFPYLRVANVSKGHMDLSDIAYLNARPGEVQHMLLRAGDLLLVEGHANIDEIGRVALADERVAGLTYQNHLFRLRPRSLKPDFCELWMNGSWVRSYWRSMCSTSSGLNTINQKTLKAIPVPIPPKREREVVTAAADACSKQLLANQDVLRSYRQLKAGLMDDLLSGRVRVPMPEGATK